MSSIELKQNLHPDAADLAWLRQRFHAFVQNKFPGLPDESHDQHFLFSLSHDNRFMGALYGRVYWDGLEIDTLWVEHHARRQGLGRRLVDEAENFARNRGAMIAFLKTVEAWDFYLHLGYETFGVLEDRPIGTLLYHMKKRLDQ